MNTITSAATFLRHDLSFGSVLRRALLCVPVVALAMTGSVRAATDTWDPLLNGTSGSNGSGTWTLSSGNFSTTGTTPNSDISPVQGSADNLTFGTGTGSAPFTVTINMGRVFYQNGFPATPTLTFASQNYTIAAATTGDGLLTGNVAVAANVTANVTALFDILGTLTVNSGSTINLSGGGFAAPFVNGPGAGATAAGTVNFTNGVWQVGNNIVLGNSINTQPLDVNFSGGLYLAGATGLHFGEVGSTVVGTVSGGVIDGGLLIGQGATGLAGSAAVTISGGQYNAANNFTVGGAGTAGSGGGNASLTITGGTVTSSQNGTIGGSANTVAVTDVMNISGGYVSFETKNLTFGAASTTYIAGSTATLNLSGGTLYVGNLLQATGATNLTSTFNYSGGLLAASAANTWTMPIVITASGGTIQTSAVDGVAEAVTASGVLSGTGALTKTGLGVLTLNVAETYSGGTNINHGTLKLDFSGASAPASNIIASGTALSLGGNGILNVNGKASTTNSQTFGAVTINSGGTGFTITNNATANPVLVALGTITENAGGTVNFTQPTNALGISATNGYTTTQVNDATGILGTWASVGTGGTMGYAANNGSNIVAYSGATVATTTNLTSATTNFNATGGLTLAGTATAYTANTLQVTGPGAAINLGTNSLTVNGLMYSGGSGTEAINASAGGGIIIGASKQLVLFGSNGMTINAPISDNALGASALVDSLSGSATLNLGGASTYTGGTYLNGGAVQLTAAENAGVSGAFGASGNIVFNGATIRYSATNTADYSSRIKNSNGAISMDLEGQTVTYASALDSSNTGGLTVTSSVAGAKLILSGANTYIGQNNFTNTSSSSATVQLSGSGTLGATTNALLVGGGTTGDIATLDLNGTNQSVGSFSGSVNGIVTNSNGSALSTLTVDSANNGASETYSGALTGNMGLTKDGISTLTLAGTASFLTYTGPTTVNGGILAYSTAGAFSASGSGAFIVNDGGQINLAAGAANSTGTLPTLSIAGYGTTMWGGAITSNGTNTIGNNITLTDNAGINGATGNLTLTGNITGNNFGLTLGGSNTGVDTISGNISLGDGGISKQSTAGGVNVWILSGTNTYTGNTLLNTGGGGAGTGILRAGSTQAFGGGTSSLVINNPAVNSAQTLDLNGFNNAFGSLVGGNATTGGIVTLGGAVLTTGGDNTNATFIGSIENPSAGNGVTSLTGGGLIKVGIGNQTLTGANLFGSTTINGGTLSTSAGVATSGATAGLTTTASAAFISGATTITVASATSLAAGESISGTGIAANTTIASINGTTVTLSTATIGAGTSGETISAGASLGTGATALIVNSTTGFVVGQVITGTGIAPNTYVTGVDTTNKIVYLSSTTTGSGSVGQSVSGASWQSLGSGALVFSNTTGATLNISAGASTVSPTVGSISGGGSLGGNIVLGTNTLTTGSDGTSTSYGGVISGGGGLTKIGGGTQTLTGLNTYTGTTTLTGGTLAFSADSGALGGNLGKNSTLLFKGGTLELTANAVSLSASRILTLTSGLTGTIQVDSGASLTVNSAIGETGASGNLTKTGAGTLIFDGGNTYTGLTTISAGVIDYEDSTSFGTGAITVANGGTAKIEDSVASGAAAQPITITGAGALGSLGALQSEGNNLYSGVLTLGGNATIGSDSGGFFELGNATAITGSGDTLTVAGAGNTQIDSVISTGMGGLVKNGTGSLTLDGQNTYTGATTINGGTVAVGVNSVAGVSGGLGLNSAVTLANTAGTTLDISLGNTQIGSLSGGGTTGGNVSLGAKTLTTGGDNTTTTYGGAIVGTGGVTKIGTGVQTFTGASNYSGGTQILGGSLYANNTTGSATGSGSISVTGGTIGGFGTINPTGTHTFSVSSGGMLAPGTVGNTDALTISATGNTHGSGMVALSGAALAFNLGAGNAASTLNLTDSFANEVTGLSGNTFNFTDLTSGGLALGLYTLIQSDDSTTNPFSGLSLGELTGFTLTGLSGYAGDTFQLELNQLSGSGDYAIQLEVIPEPGTWAMMLGGLAVLMFWQRRRRSS